MKPLKVKEENQIIELNIAKLPEIPLNEPVLLLSLSSCKEGAFASWSEVYSAVVVKEIVSSDIENVGLVYGVNAFEPNVGKLALRVDRLDASRGQLMSLDSIKLY